MSGLGSSGPGGLRQHHTRLLTGGGVDVVVAEENLRSRSAGSSVLGHVVGTDVDCGGGRLFDHLDGGSLAVGTAHTVGLTFGGHDDQEDSTALLLEQSPVPISEIICDICLRLFGSIFNPVCYQINALFSEPYLNHGSRNQFIINQYYSPHREIGTIATVREQLDANRESWLAEQADRRQRRKEWQAEIRKRKERATELLCK